MKILDQYTVKSLKLDTLINWTLFLGIEYIHRINIMSDLYKLANLKLDRALSPHLKEKSGNFFHILQELLKFIKPGNSCNCCT